MSISRRTVLFPILLLVLAASSPQWAFSKGKMPPPDAEEEDAEDQAPAKQELKQAEEPVRKEEVAPQKEEKVQASTETPRQESQAAEMQTEPKKETETPLKKYPPATVMEETPPLSAGSKMHTVWIWQETRDCLWQLAKEHYGDPWQWKKIYLANRNTILDPNVIFPKQKIIIPSLAQNSK